LIEYRTKSKIRITYIKISIITEVRQNQNTFAKIKYDSTKEGKKTEDLKNMRAENLLELRITEIQNIWFILSHLYHVNGSSYIYYYLKAKNRRKNTNINLPNFKLQKNT
jgi:hypothetical protein